MSVETKPAKFGSRWSIVRTDTYTLTITTAKEGFLKGLSTIVWEGIFPSVTLVRKVLYLNSVTKKERLSSHDWLAEILDNRGNAGESLVNALNKAFEELRQSNLAMEVINVPDTSSTNHRDVVAVKRASSQAESEDQSDTSMFSFAADILSQSLEVLQTVRDINPEIEDWPKMKRGQTYMLSISEMLFLIMHYVNRAIYQMMSQPARLEFMDRLGATVAEGLAQYLKVPTHGQERDQFEADFFKALNDREMEYGHCKAIFKEENISEDETVIYKGFYRLLGVIYPGDEPFEKNHILAVIKTINTIFTELKLDKHLSKLI